MLLIECEFSWFTVGPVPSLDVSVSLLFLYSEENDPRPRRWHASSYSDPSVFQHLLHCTDPLHWGEVKIWTFILAQPGVLLHNCRYFNHMLAANASVHFFPPAAPLETAESGYFTMSPRRPSIYFKCLYTTFSYINIYPLYSVISNIYTLASVILNCWCVPLDI